MTSSFANTLHASGQVNQTNTATSAYTSDWDGCTCTVRSGEMANADVDVIAADRTTGTFDRFDVHGEKVRRARSRSWAHANSEKVLKPPILPKRQVRYGLAEAIEASGNVSAQMNPIRKQDVTRLEGCLDDWLEQIRGQEPPT